MRSDLRGDARESATSDLDYRCSCGSLHPIDIEMVVISDTAIDELVSYGERHSWSRPFVVMDANTEEVLGGEVIEALRGRSMLPESLSFPERSGLLADAKSVERLEDALRSSTPDAVIAVGSGVVTDVTRFVTHRLGSEFVSVPTAASMDGYASSVAAMQFDGMKTTSSAIAPSAIFADPRVIARAPREMTRSGIGDLLGKASAHIDWHLSHGLWAEPLCEVVERRVADPMVHVASHVREILEQSPEGVEQLLRGLVESGIAMTMVGSSRPASGCEHHASHFWDLQASLGRQLHAPHGLQVGYATHFALRLQEWALAGDHIGVPTLPRAPEPESDEARSWFAGHLLEVEAVMEEKQSFSSSHEKAWPRSAPSWAAVLAGTEGARSVAPLVHAALHAAEIPDTPGFLDLDAEMLSATFRFANRIRARYTVIDFLEGQGLLDEGVASVLGQISY